MGTDVFHQVAHADRLNMWGDLFRFPEGVQTRWASAENRGAELAGGCLGNDGRKRFPCIHPLGAGETATLLDVRAASGTIRRIWVTINDRSPMMMRGLRLRMAWDGASACAVDVPLGDFFCHALGEASAFENALFSSPEGRSFNCVVPMPFRSGARITVTNETDRELDMLFFEVDFTSGDVHASDALYFHAHWRRENPTMLGVDYTLLPRVEGRGRILGMNIGVIADTGKYFRSWWGEGEVKVFLDDDTDHPTLCGTGTEDYIGTGWGQGRYAQAYQGCPVADDERFRYGFYRLHVPDPVVFTKRARATIQQIGCWNPGTIQQMHDSGITLQHGAATIGWAEALKREYGYFEREDDWSSCAWFYLDSPTNGLPALQDLSVRVAGLDLGDAPMQAMA